VHDLKLVSGWYSGTLLGREIEEEKDRIAAQLQLFSALGASVIVYGETWNTVQNRRDRTLNQRPVIAPADIPAYGRRLSALAVHCQERGVPLVFHHHMGTGVETEAELDLVMSHTGEEVGLLLDTGHLCFAGGDIARVIEHHGSRIKHVHAKDIRKDVLVGVDRERMSFLECVLDGVFTVPGDGMIDFLSVAQCLAVIEYEGWVIVEAEQDPVRANPFEYAKNGYKFLESALTAVGYEISA
jgi:inosose dehydratase